MNAPPAPFPDEEESKYGPTERRPIASRNLRVMQWLASVLVRMNISPNAISIAGMLCALAGGFAFAATSWNVEYPRLLWIAAALFVQLRLLANLLDGMVAIESGKASPVGELYNEVPDRVSDAAILVGAGYALGGDVVLGFTAACVAIFTAYIRAMGKAAGAAQDYGGPMAKPQRMFVMTVLGVFHGFAPTDWYMQLEKPAGWGFVAIGLAVIIVLGLVTAWRRLLRIASFLKRTP